MAQVDAVGRTVNDHLLVLPAGFGGDAVRMVGGTDGDIGLAGFQAADRQTGVLPGPCRSCGGRRYTVLDDVLAHDLHLVDAAVDPAAEQDTGGDILFPQRYRVVQTVGHLDDRAALRALAAEHDDGIGADPALAPVVAALRTFGQPDPCVGTGDDGDSYGKEQASHRGSLEAWDAGGSTVGIMQPKTVLVVGASRGIGLVIAEHLVTQGFQVIGTVRGESAAPQLQAAGITPLVLDVTDHTAVAALPEHVGSLDALVYNAGLSVAGPVELLDIELAQAEVNVNYVGAAAVTKAVLPLLRASRGHIVYVTSVNGTAPVGLYASYSASKFALEGFAEALAIEVAGTGVKVTVIEPGICNTDMLPQDIAVLEGKKQQAPDYLVPQLDETIHAIKVLKPNDPQVVARAVGRVLTRSRPRFRVVAPRMPYAVMTVGHRLLPLSGYKKLVALSTPKRGPRAGG